MQTCKDFFPFVQNDKKKNPEYISITTNLENNLGVSLNVKRVLTIWPSQSWIFTQKRQKHMSTQGLEHECSQKLYF